MHVKTPTSIYIIDKSSTLVIAIILMWSESSIKKDQNENVTGSPCNENHDGPTRRWKSYWSHHNLTMVPLLTLKASTDFISYLYKNNTKQFIKYLLFLSTHRHVGQWTMHVPPRGPAQPSLGFAWILEALAKYICHVRLENSTDLLCSEFRI